MPRKVKKHKKPTTKTFYYYVINLKIRFHGDKSPDLTSAQYAEQFRKFYLEFIPGNSSHQKQCVLTSQTTIKSQTGFEYFVGQLVQTTKINNRKWFDKIKNALAPHFSVPEYYGANACVTEYVFVPEVHRFAYRTTAKDFIDPRSVRKYLMDAVPKALGDGYIVHVDVESEKTALETILSARIIKKVVITINYSNADFSSAMQKFVENDIKNNNVDTFHIVASRKKDSSIDVNNSQILKGSLESSISNGESTVSLIDADGKAKTVSTKNLPEKLIIQSTSEELQRVNDVYGKLTSDYGNANQTN